MDHPKIVEYQSKMSDIQDSILYFLDETQDIDAAFYDFKKTIQESEYQTNKDIFTSILILVIKISNNYHRSSDFFEKIQQIFKYFCNEIKQTYSNLEIFHIIKSNKRILLFFIKENLIVVDKSIAQKIIFYRSKFYPQFFYPEIEKFIDDEELRKSLSIEIDDEFEKKRENGENDSYICEVIRNDSIQEFTKLIEKKIISHNSLIPASIFETNSYLLKNPQNVSLFEYASFFGSIQIIQYLNLNEAKLTKSLWYYAVHSNNPSIIHFLEDNRVDLDKEEHIKLYFESMKCFHNEITNYLRDNYLYDKSEKEMTVAEIRNYSFLRFKRQDIEMKTYDLSLKYYNFKYLKNDIDMKVAFLTACRYNNLYLVKFFSQNQGFDVGDYITFKIMIHSNEKIIGKISTFFLFFYKIGLHDAVEKGNLEIVKFLTPFNDKDINLPIILSIYINVIPNLFSFCK